MKEATRYNFVKVGNGRLALNHRPGGKDFPLLRELGCTHVVTLLKESEFAKTVGVHTNSAGLEWVWIPVPNGNYPQGEVHQHLLAAMPKLSKLLDEGKSLLIHCSAGIHRTGTVAYGLLRWRGMERDEAMQVILQIRPVTAEGMLEKRRRWGDENSRQIKLPNSFWTNLLKRLLKK
jgi:protein-tyrosine phosphatase